MAVERVRERVRHGGHDIPETVIARRFVRGLRHMLDDYAPICDFTVCLDNSRSPPGPIFVRQRDSKWMTPGCSGSWKPCDD